MSCNVCCENYNKSLHKVIVCGKCDFHACKSCVRHYLMNSFNDPHCMSCKTLYSDEFLVESVNRSFMSGQYKNHRKELFYQRELSRLPETMTAAEQEKKARVLVNECKTLDTEIEDLSNKIRQLQKSKRLANIKISELRNQKQGKEKQKFIMPCSKSGCKGFLSSSYKCELCNLYTCKDCLELLAVENPLTKEWECIKNSDTHQHICNEETVATATLIKNSTKPCPSCGERIQKIDGCDQMWCSNCNNAFSWNTGIIDNGPIHNPHYFEFLRRAGDVDQQRNVNDVVCGGVPQHLLRTVISSDFKKHLIKLNPTNSTFTQKVLNFLVDMIRQVTHVTQVTVVSYRQIMVNTQNTMPLRVKYMLNDFDDEQFKNAIFHQDVHRRRCLQQLNIWESYSTVGIDLLRYIESKCTLKITQAEWDTVVNELRNFERFIDYFNSTMKDISKTYNIKTCRFYGSFEEGRIYSKNELK